jgi:sugar-specific transcriptional regulator TrmB
MFESEFEAFGFSENETRIYLALLRLGALHPTELAQKTGLNRSYLYDLLNRMQEKGYLSTVKTRDKLCYQAVAPRQLYELVRLRIETFATIIGQLEKLPGEKEDTSLEMHRGKGVFRTLTRDLFNSIRDGGEVLIISADEHAFEEHDPTGLAQYYRSLIERKGSERILIKRGGSRLTQPTTAYRELPPEIIGNSSLFIYVDTVAEILLGTPNYMTITRNKEMADAKRKLFEHLWKSAKQ